MRLLTVIRNWIFEFISRPTGVRVGLIRAAHFKARLLRPTDFRIGFLFTTDFGVGLIRPTDFRVGLLRPADFGVGLGCVRFQSWGTISVRYQS